MVANTLFSLHSAYVKLKNNDKKKIRQKKNKILTQLSMS